MRQELPLAPKPLTHHLPLKVPDTFYLEIGHVLNEMSKLHCIVFGSNQFRLLLKVWTDNIIGRALSDLLRDIPLMVY
jgi:hypothetical protein